MPQQTKAKKVTQTKSQSQSKSKSKSQVSRRATTTRQSGGGLSDIIKFLVPGKPKEDATPASVSTPTPAEEKEKPGFLSGLFSKKPQEPVAAASPQPTEEKRGFFAGISDWFGKKTTPQAAPPAGVGAPDKQPPGTPGTGAVGAAAPPADGQSGGKKTKKRAVAKKHKK